MAEQGAGRVTEGAWQSSQELDLAAIWRLLLRNKWLIIAIALACAAASLLYALSMTPIYRATATLLIDTGEANIVSIEQIYSAELRRQEYLQTQYQILRSRPLAESVVETLGMIAEPEIHESGERLGMPAWIRSLLSGTETRSATARERAVEGYLDALSIEPVFGTQLVRIGFRSEDPEIAALAANQHADRYVENLLESRLAMTRSAASWLSERVEELRQELVSSERRLQEYRERESIVDSQGLRSLPTQRINDLSTRLVEVRQVLSSAEIAYQQVVEAADDPERLQRIPLVAADENVQRARDAVARAGQAIAELQQRYGPQHPSMIAAQAEHASTIRNLHEQQESVAARIRTRFEVAQFEAAALAAELDEARAQYQTVGRKESDLNSLQRAVETNRQLYELFYNRLSETLATDDLQTAAARIVEPALVPRAPAEPDRRLVVALGSFGGLALGALAAFGLSLLNSTINSMSEAERKLDLPLLAAVPALGGAARQRRRGWSRGSGGQAVDEWRFREAFRALRTSLAVSETDGRGHRIIVVTSAIGHEGKSTVALNLAKAFASAERTLLIDTDMRRPSIAGLAEVRRNGPGLAELLEGRATLRECIRQTGTENLDLIPTISVPLDPLQLLSSATFTETLAVVAEEYSRIIMDSAPVLSVSDAALLCSQAGAAVFVVKASSTPVAQIRSALSLLERASAPIAGVVLNQLDFRMAQHYGDYGYEMYAYNHASPSRRGM